MTGTCQDCGSTELHAKGRCTPCYWKAKRDALKEECPSCGLRRILRSGPGICGMCDRRARPRKEPTQRICDGCGRLALHDGLGLCSRCYQKDPARIATWTEGAMGRLGNSTPPWFPSLASDLAERCAAPVAREHLRKIEHLLHAGCLAPEALIRGLATPGRSAGSTARLLDEFFIRTGVGTHLEEPARLAAERRNRRLDSVPTPLRHGVQAFTDHLLASRERSELAGVNKLADVTIEARISDLAKLGQQLAGRSITDWASVSVSDIEEFVATNTGQRLASCRGFFGFARRRRLILIDPTGTIECERPRGFGGRVLTIEEQRKLLTRWSSRRVSPAERSAGLLGLLHGASRTELQCLLVDDINARTATIRFADRPHPLPLDPLTTDALNELIALRLYPGTENRHLFTTRYTRAHQGQASSSFMTHVLDGTGINLKILRQTRLADMAHRLDPRLVAAAFGMTEGGALHYVTGSVDGEDHHFGPHL